MGNLLATTSNLLYKAPEVFGNAEFQEKNLKLPLLEVSTEGFLLDVFGDFKGNLCIFQKKSNGTTANIFYKKKDTDRMFKFLEKTFGIDTYISYSTYFKRKKRKDEVLRTQSNIVHTYMLVQDLDYYKLGMTDAECLQSLGEMIHNGELLCPNYVVSTGRGYQLIWLVEPFKNISGYSNDKDWRTIQEFLYKKLEPFNSDVVVKNPSAVTRLPGSKHRISQNIVYAYLANQACFTLKDFIFYHDLIPASDRSVKPRKQAIRQVTRITSNWNEFTLNRYREEDIFTFVQIQNERGISYIGIRNWLALVLRFHAIVSSDGDYSYGVERVGQLCTIMDMSETSDKEILRRSQPAEKYYEDWKNDSWDKDKYLRGGLFYTNARMLDLMNIKEDYYVQWKMKTIKIKNKKYDAARKHFERLKKGQVQGNMEQYNALRKEKKEDKVDELRKLLKENPKLKNNQLAEIMGVHRNTISNFKKLI